MSRYYIVKPGRAEKLAVAKGRNYAEEQLWVFTPSDVASGWDRICRTESQWL